MTEQEKYELIKAKLYYAIEKRKREDYENLYEIQKALNNYLIEKACDWLNEHMPFGETSREEVIKCITDFKQAMRDGAE